MKIRNKLESIELIKLLNLNRFPEELFNKGEDDKVAKFIDNYKATYYAIRDKSKPGGIFKLSVLYDDVLDEIKDYSIYTINVSSINYADNQILVGEIEVLSNNDVYLTVTTNPKASVRDALKSPEFNIKTNIFDKRLDSIRGFNTIYNYIVTNNLKDIIVEFALFNIRVGVNNDFVIIYELRTNY